MSGELMDYEWKETRPKSATGKTQSKRTFHFSSNPPTALFFVDSELLAHSTLLSTRRPSASSPPDSFRVFPFLSGSLADCDLLDHSFEIR
jgi:hypothetical protein